MSNKKRDCKVISIINMKGGVGKTTLTKELGCYMASKQNKKILFVDLDPQSNLTQSFFLRKKLRHKEDLNTPNQNSEIVTQSIQKLFDTSAISELDESEIILKLEDDYTLDLIPGTLSTLFLERASNTSNMEKAIYNLIDEKKLRDKYDYILIDCPPTFSVYTVSALLPSDYYLIPVDPGIYSVLGISMLEKVVKAIIMPNKPFFKDKPLSNLGVIFTKYQKPQDDLINMIETTKTLQKMYFFKERFLYTKKLIDRPLYSIVESTDDKLTKNLKDIFKEMEVRINEIKK